MQAPTTMMPPKDEDSGQPQKATRKSCRFCRSRKIKCSGETEGCKACQSRNIECNYDPTATMGRPRKYPRASDGQPTKRPVGTPVSAQPRPSTEAQAQVDETAWQPWLMQGPQQQSSPWPVTSTASSAGYGDVNRPTDGHDLATLADASGWAAATDTTQWPFSHLAGLGGSVSTPLTLSNGHRSFSGAIPTSVDRRSMEANIEARREHGLKRKASEMSGASPTVSSATSSGTPPVHGAPSLGTPPTTVSDVFTTTDLATTFKAFRGKSIAAMATAHLEFLSKEASPISRPPPMVDDRASDPALTRRHYLAAFKRIASSAAHSELISSERAKFADSWDAHAEMICDCINIAMTEEDAVNRPVTKYIGMLRQDKVGELLLQRSSDGIEAPVDQIPIDRQIQMVETWHATTPLALLVNDGLLRSQMGQGGHDRALLSVIVGWVTFIQDPSDQTIEGHFDYAERALLARHVGIDHLQAVLGTTQALILLAAFRAERQELSKSWALFSVAHGLARASVRQTQAAELEARRRNVMRSVLPEQRAMEENMLSCCWLLALFGSWCFLSMDMPKTSVLDMIDGLPALPLNASESVSYQIRSTTPSFRTSDEPLAFAIEFFSESSGALGVIARLWSRGTAPVPESELEPDADPSRLNAGLAWRKSLYGDPRLSAIAVVGPIISQMLVQDAVELYESSSTVPIFPALDSQWSFIQPPQVARRSLLASTHVVLALYRLGPTVNIMGGHASVAPPAMRTVIKGLAVLADAATVAAAQTLPALTALKSAAVSRICSMAFPRSIGILHDAVDRARSSHDHFIVVAQMVGKLRKLLGELQTLASAGVVTIEDAGRAAQILAIVNVLCPLDTFTPTDGSRSTSVPSFLDNSLVSSPFDSQQGVSLVSAPLDATGLLEVLPPQ